MRTTRTVVTYGPAAVHLIFTGRHGPTEDTTRWVTPGAERSLTGSRETSVT